MADVEGEYLEVNRANWDARVPLHLQGYDLDRFRTEPDFISDVVRFDHPRLPDLKGLRGLHLQCHIGTDTISLARLGAQMTGLDFSPAAIAAARDLAGELQLAIQFVEGEVYGAMQFLEKAGAQTCYDFVYTGIGALCWIPRIQPWARVVQSLLKPGGFLFFREGHPMLWALETTESQNNLELAYDYFEGESVYLEETESYTGKGTVSSPGNFSFNHGLAEIFNALWRAGLVVELFEEHESVPWNPSGDAFEWDEALREYRLRGHPKRLPATYSLRARRPREG